MAKDDVTVKVAGLKSLAKVYDALPIEFEKKALRATLRSAAIPIRNEARNNAPLATEVINVRGKKVEPGRLKNNIVVRTRSKGANKKRAAVEVIVRGSTRLDTTDPKNAWFWWFPEFGTSKQPAQPYLRPSLPAKAGAAISKFSKVAQDRIATQAKKLDAWQRQQLKREIDRIKNGR